MSGVIVPCVRTGAREKSSGRSPGIGCPADCPGPYPPVRFGGIGRAVAGRSGMVVARGPQAAGKTRSCWEALRGIPADWRLWHPADPFDGTQVVEGLAQAGPRTVVWLDRVERYLDPVQYRGAGAVQAELGNALHDSRQAPVLVIGTVSAAAGGLTRSGGLTSAADTVVRTLIEDAVVDVSPRFTKAELVRLADLAELDDRLAAARDNARTAVPKFLATSRKAHRILAPESFHTAVEQGDTDTFFMGGTLLRQSGRLEEAATSYQRAAEAGDSQAIEPAAALLTESGEPQEAISWLQSLAEAGDPDAAVAAARRLLATGRDTEAIRTYRHAALAGDSNRALRAAAALMRRSGRTQEAVRWLRTCAERGNLVALQEAAHLLWEMGDRTRALKFYTDAGSAGELAAWRDAAERLQTLGRGDEAVIMYRAAVRHGDRQSGLPLADLLVEQGRLQEALEIYLEEAEKQRDPEEQNPDLAVLRRVANLYRFTEQPDEALAWLHEAADRGDVAAFMQIGLILGTNATRGSLVWTRRSPRSHGLLLRLSGLPTGSQSGCFANTGASKPPSSGCTGGSRRRTGGLCGRWRTSCGRPGWSRRPSPGTCGPRSRAVSTPPSTPCGCRPSCCPARTPRFRRKARGRQRPERLKRPKSCDR
ncbi:tetratricopeptide repeat protein [Kitasatospora purpeofusca]|uniref:tetratricopeptide repeat protein n=1 Tax=Kitasatospora purpeofusca TaxID=67352 RepID=UPI0022584769|nr:tetratricopeptide repeat protein [Kitasatospora purpeofusca]MCX4690676.1 tetratricopeptide repeat protein [Kitasatospora purpeofusca]